MSLISDRSDKLLPLLDRGVCGTEETTESAVARKSKPSALRPHPEAQGFIVTYAGKERERERRERVGECASAVRREKGALISGNIRQDGE